MGHESKSGIFMDPDPSLGPGAAAPGRWLDRYPVEDDGLETVIETMPPFASELESLAKASGSSASLSEAVVHREAATAARKGFDAGPEAAGAGILERLRAVFAQSTALQVGLVALVAGAMVALWVMLEQKEAERARPAARQGGALELAHVRSPFPEIQVEGAEPVRPEDVRRLFRARSKVAPRADEAPSTPETEAPVGREPVRLVPGVVVDPDDPESRARANEAAREWQDQRQSRPTRLRSRNSQGGPLAEPARSSAQFFVPGGVIEGVGTLGKTSQAPGLELDTGVQLHAQLELGVTSSRLGVVLARVTKDVIQDGRRIVRKGAILRGRASANDERIFVRFFEMEDAGVAHPIEAEAVEGALPGLRAKRREATYEERSSAAALRGTLGAVQGAARAVAPGTLVGEVADGVVRETVPEAKEELEVRRGYVLEVAAGRRFLVVVTGRAR